MVASWEFADLQAAASIFPKISQMKIFLTGGTGFIGAKIAEILRSRGDEVVALVRDPNRAQFLSGLDCQLVRGSLTDKEAIATGIAGCDGVIHCAAIYEVGIPEGERLPMKEANVDGTTNVLEAALAEGVTKAVYVSTCAVFGNTKGKVVDESYEAPAGEYTSYYEETKALAHAEALRLAAKGLPVVVVQPGGVYGPGDESALGQVILKYAKKQLPALMFPDLGLTVVHRDDIAAGIVLALDKGRSGQSYVMGGDIETIRGVVATEARILGRKVPRVVIPAGLFKLLHPFGKAVGPLFGAGPNLKEVVSSADGVTYWASSEKAKSELGYQSRGLEDGLRETLGREGLLQV
jgi:nucleoside-diphosphate-sugar epimerase